MTRPEFGKIDYERDAGLPQRIRDMRAAYGVRAGVNCGSCRHFLRFPQATWFKCEETRMTGGAATDWRARWPACGLYETVHTEDMLAAPNCPHCG